mgnify:CR=1 FL=1
MPDEKNCSYTFKKNKKFVLYPEQNGKIFKNDCIYISFTSYRGVSVQLLIDFHKGSSASPSPKTKIVTKDEKKEDNNAINLLISCGKDSSPERNIVKENKRTVTVWPNIRNQKLKMNQNILLNRVKKCQFRK